MSESVRIKINVLGITFSQIQAGAYALILGEENGTRRMPVIIGTPEAQSIAIFLEGLHPPRPLTHDMFVTFMRMYEIDIEEIFIYKYEEGVFFSEIRFKGGKEVTLDARTSDAIALALRCKAPIYTTEEIMESAGVMMDDSDYEIQDEELHSFAQEEELSPSMESKTKEELQIMLDNAIAIEDYEAASNIKEELNRRFA